jgi:SAM-dependent methyltransferase
VKPPASQTSVVQGARWRAVAYHAPHVATFPEHHDADAHLRAYYEQRAHEYEAIYRRDDPVRQAEQDAIADALRAHLAGRRVLEIACGTGYWTGVIASVADAVVAIDAAPAMLAIARHRGLDPARVGFRSADAYNLAAVTGDFDAAVANFWLSHVPRRRLEPFLQQLHTRLGSGARIFMADNVLVASVGGELVSRRDSDDTYKRRTLSDGTTREIVKNYFTEHELRALLAPHARELDIHVGQCFWWVRYRTVTPAAPVS